MNNSLMLYGPRLWNELNIDKRKLVYISLFIINIFNYFVISDFLDLLIFYTSNYILYFINF